MAVWVLILTLYQPLDRLETVIPVETPFASYDACWLAGYRVSELEDLNLSPRPAAKRIAWVCVPSARPDLEPERCPECFGREGMRRLSCDSRPECRALREDLRGAIRRNRERFERMDEGA